MQQTIPIVKLRFEFKTQNSISFPSYAGSTLRGIFGLSLKRLACMAKKDDCTKCAICQTCPYPLIFESFSIPTDERKSTQIPNPYVIEPMQWGQKTYQTGETFYFHQILFGKATEHLPIILYAWKQGFLKGVGKGRGTAQLQKVYQVLPNEDICLFDCENDDGFQKPVTGYPLTIKLQSPFIDLRFVTPLRIHKNGHPIVPDALTANDIITSLQRRVTSLYQYHTDTPVSFDLNGYNIDIINKDFRWLDWKRYSYRQDQKIALGGIVGNCRLAGDVDKIALLIKAGELLHTGKSTVLGLGKYEVING